MRGLLVSIQVQVIVQAPGLTIATMALQIATPRQSRQCLTRPSLPVLVYHRLFMEPNGTTAFLGPSRSNIAAHSLMPSGPIK